jgi:hypothetical protein
MAHVHFGLMALEKRSGRPRDLLISDLKEAMKRPSLTLN